jgi:hypothetical protein
MEKKKVELKVVRLQPDNIVMKQELYAANVETERLLQIMNPV